MDLVCLEMHEKVYLNLWVKLGCTPRRTQIVPKWHLAGQLANWPEVIFSTCAWKWIWVDSACGKMRKKVYLNLWVKLGCSLLCTQRMPKWRQLPRRFL